MRQTPLYEFHQKLGAKIVEFAGYGMPIWYTGIVDEHNFVRKNCGIFDVSHMAEFTVKGPGSLDFIDRLTTNAVRTMTDGKVMYTLLCREDGGCIDDLLAYRIKENDYLIVANASNRDPVREWFEKNAARFDVSVADISDRTAMIAVQGPLSSEVLKDIGFFGHEKIPYYSAAFLDFQGKSLLCSRTGYTGEDGFEFFGSGDDIAALWTCLLKQEAVRPIGLGARDTLRLECGFSLYGHELALDITPLEAGLSWAVDLSKDFIGKEAMAAKGRSRSIAGFEMLEKAIARPGCEVFSQEGGKCGHVTSGSFLPSLDKNMGLCLIIKDKAVPGQQIFMDIRGQKKKAQVVKRPFYTPVQRRRNPS